MKILIFSIITLAALSLQAQPAGGYLTTLQGGTNFVAAASTNTYAIQPLPIAEFDHVGLTASFSCAGANGSNVTFRAVQAYVDTSHFESLPSLSGSITANGTNKVSAGFDFFCPASSFVAIATIENPGPAAVTNLFVKWLLKTPKRGANTRVSP